MSSYAIASIPCNPVYGPSFQRGARPDNRLAAWQRYGMWHPALPEVRVLFQRRDIWRDIQPMGVHTFTPGRECRFRQAYTVAAFLLFLLLPLTAHAAEPCRVNVNSAPPAQLALLINTGPALASKIEAARKPEPLDAAKLDAVPGIGIKWLEHNAPHVAYSGETTCMEKLRKPSATGETESDTVRKEASGGGQ